MAQKRPRRRKPRGSDDAPSAASASGKEWPPVGSVPSRREVRPYIYAGLDFAMAIVYALMLSQVPTRHTHHQILIWSTVGAVVVAGAGMLWRSPWGRRVAMAGCAVLLAVTVFLLVMILLSASFLAGVYGSMGRGAAGMALLAGALAIELIGLLPAFQLKFLMTRAGRHHFARAAARPGAESPR